MKRTLLFLLIAAMMFSLLACTSTPAPAAPQDTTVTEPAENQPAAETPADEPAEAPAEEPADEPIEEPAEEPADEPVEEPTEEPAGPAPLTLPVTPELTTFTGWAPGNLIDPTIGREDLAEQIVFQEAAKRTNVQWEWQYGPTTDAATAFSLILASGEYPDAFLVGSSSFPNGLQYAIDEEIIIDLKPIVDEYCPNYYEVYQKEDVRRILLLDSHALPAFRMVNVTNQPTYLGYFSTADALAAAGFSADNLPYTLDDYESILSANQGKMYLNSNTGMDSILLSAYNITASFFAKHDSGEVVYGPSTDEYRQYLELVSDWYGKGLIDPDYLSRIHYYVDLGTFMSREVIMYPGLYTFVTAFEGAGLNPVALPYPHLSKGDVRYTSAGSKTDRTSLGEPAIHISAQCEDPITLAKFCDYTYSPEGMILYNYGIEGTSYELVDGEPVFTDLVTNNPDGLTFNKAVELYATITLYPMHYWWERELVVVTDSALTAQNTWHADRDLSNPYEMYGDLTLEEMEEVGSIVNDIQSYVQEFTNKVIVGEESLDNWDAYLANLEQMHLDACIEAYQAAYDRYLAR